MIFTASHINKMRLMIAVGNSQEAVVYAHQNSARISSLEQAQRATDQLLRGVFDNDAAGIPGAVGTGTTEERPKNPKIGEEFFDITEDLWVKWNGAEWRTLTGVVL